MRKWAILIVLTSVLAANCGFSGKRIKGNGQVTTENRNVSNFTGVSSYGSFNVYVSIGNTSSVKIEGESNILPYIETYVDKDNTLKIDSKDGVWLSTSKQVNIYVTAPRFGKIYSIGSGAIIGETPITDSAKLDLQVKGNGSIKLDVDAPTVEAVLTGNGSVHLNGQSQSFECRLLGNGKLRAFDLKAEDAKVSIMGNGDAELYASVKLDVTIGGNGNVRYKGGAQPSTHITGNGNIKQVQ
jgi:hypothetical protein